MWYLCRVYNEQQRENRRRLRREYMYRWRRKPEKQADVRARDREHHRKKWDERRILVDAAKNVPCTDCQRTFPAYVLDFDHVRGEKLFPIGREVGRATLSALIEEIEKCDVVCANCHRERTHQRKLAHTKSSEQPILTAPDVP